VGAAATEAASTAPLAAAHHHTRKRFLRDIFRSLKELFVANAV
jgi:hypothetical protein